VHEHHVQASIAGQIGKADGLSADFGDLGWPADPSLYPSIAIIHLRPSLYLSA
jgi:hypothetical protein